MKNLVILGAGGFAREVAQYVKDINKISPTFNLLGYIDEDKSKHGKTYEGFKVLGGFSALIPTSNLTLNLTLNLDLASDSTLYCICAIANPVVKQRLVQEAKKLGLKFTNIIHPTAYIGDSVTLGEGIIIGPYCTITVNVHIGNHVSINPLCGIGHDSYISDYTTLYWNISVSGNVHIGKGVQIGSKAFIKQGVQVNDNSFIGAGAVVLENVEEKVTVVGVPAREMEMNKK